MRILNYGMMAKISYTSLVGLIGSLDAYVASQTHDPLTIATSAFLLYATAESTNRTLGSEKFLCQKAFGKIKHYLKKLHR